MGVVSAAIFIASIPYYYRNRNYALEMPNSVNFSFNFGVFLALFTTTIFPYRQSLFCYSVVVCPK